MLIERLGFKIMKYYGISLDFIINKIKIYIEIYSY